MTFLDACLQALDLALPVSLDIREGLDLQGYGPVDGWCISWPDRHEIVVDASPSRGLHSTIAHELCHAYVQEQWGDIVWHGKKFRKVANWLQAHLEEMGYYFDMDIFLDHADK